ncbi:MAG: nucleoside triphosphate pyrophosphohydrolase [Bacteroidota bacterium]|nr:nucleoside triphosphate pyrophosphohydrolase [Bacteroidota bacterium]
MISRYLIDKESEFQPLLVGIKALNLIPYRLFTPEYIVLTTEFYAGWQASTKTFLNDNRDTLTTIARYFQQRDHEQIILRSSCTEEDMHARGKYHSKRCKPSVEDIRAALEEIYVDFQRSEERLDLQLAILIQVYRRPKMKGHMSNERRVSASKLDWMIEKDIASGMDSEPEDFTAGSHERGLELSLINASNASTAINNLKKFAAYFSQLSGVYHVEWVWDGQKSWLVQVDQQEDDIFEGTKPGSEWKVERKKISGKAIPDLEVLETVESVTNPWRKIENIRTFIACGLDYWPVYILENAAVIESVLADATDVSLITDLKKILVLPIVIRTETVKKDSMSPRTDTISTYQEALKFIKDKSELFIQDGLQSDQFCFLIHQFISSTAGALAITKPNTQVVRIDSIWGIVEGLYYHPYDSFEYNKGKDNISKKIRCKSQYVDVDAAGNWKIKPAGIKYDWRPSLTDDQVRRIAHDTDLIAKHLRKPVNVMFFINKGNGYPEILPWFYSDEITEVGKVYENFLSVKNKVIICSRADFERLVTAGNDGVKKNLFIDLNVKDLRDRKLIVEMADFAKAHDCIVDIKGSMLAHAFYVFDSRGVNIRCIDPFEADHSIKKFYKLVRDKIPTMIGSNDENVQSYRATPEAFLSLLKDKLVEEANEFKWARSDEQNIEELADVLEVLRGVCKLYDLSLDDLEQIADEKREKRGGFEEGVVLVATQEQSVIKLRAEQTELFEPTEGALDVKRKPTLQMFSRGPIDNFKSLTEIDHIILPYVNNLSVLKDSFRYLLKNEPFNAVEIEYHQGGINLKFEVLEEIIEDPSQLSLYPSATPENGV